MRLMRDVRSPRSFYAHATAVPRGMTMDSELGDAMAKYGMLLHEEGMVELLVGDLELLASR